MNCENSWGFRELKLSPVRAEKAIKVLEESGFSFARQKGSHIILQHSDGRSVVIPDHQGEELGRGILRAIIRQVGLTREEFLTKILKY
ncbi:MAG: type II toxin-antitoxin system HicA family toxin [Methanoculleus chikugoensis]|nr:type II toxin-antitoxin system HicA family toxin [Methanoculleus chikugoensis]NMA11011.1 type II toxin-antitoxin system HicA family toxin [Methanomicrobiales archaeon]